MAPENVTSETVNYFPLIRILTGTHDNWLCLITLLVAISRPQCTYTGKPLEMANEAIKQQREYAIDALRVYRELLGDVHHKELTDMIDKVLADECHK